MPRATGNIVSMMAAITATTTAMITKGRLVREKGMAKDMTSINWMQE